MMHYTEYPNYWYILFVLTGHEQHAANDIRMYFTQEKILPFIPTVERLFKKGTKIKKENHVIFPGYVFIETNLDGDKLGECLFEIIRKSNCIVRLLHDENGVGMVVSDAERKTISMFWRNERKIEASQGLIDGNQIKIISGSLKGMESIVKKIDRHRREAIVELNLFGKPHSIKIALDIIEKI